MSDSPDYKATVRSAVLGEGAFLRLTFTGAARGEKAGAGDTPAWERVSLRPVEAGRRRQVQFAYTAGKKHITKNFAGEELARRLEELLAAPFRHVEMQSGAGDLHVRLTAKGKALVSAGKASRPEEAPVLEHDHRKAYLLPADASDAFLRGAGFVGPSGQVKAAMAGKFRQVNEFLRAIEPIAMGLALGTRGQDARDTRGRDARDTQGRDALATQGLYLVDCGCGNAYLTFAAFHYLKHVRGVEVAAVGVDRSADLIRNCLNLRDRLGWGELDFQVAAIADFRPSRPPDMVVSLHACDTATDEAIAQGVRWGSRAILAAPCCQHELHHMVRQPIFQAMLRHGLLRERLADLLTDSLRAAALRVAGYSARVFEFVSPEHTSKNLLIVAEKVPRPAADLAAAAREYLELKRFWNVTPFIEKALGPVFQQALNRTEKGEVSDG